MNKAKNILKLYIAFAIVLLQCNTLFAQSKAEWKAMKAPITLMVANDTGRNGYYDQKPIAETMGLVADVVGPECVMAIGDIHHFDGVASVNDPLWLTNYELIYSNPELMIPWHPVLGNHEYRGNTQAVLDYGKVSRRWEMPARYYSKVFNEKGVSVRVVFIDTAPLIDKYRNQTATYPDACKQDMNAQLKWLDNELASATENWVIVAGHHPIYADTKKSDKERTDMQKRVEPLLKKHKVDMYVCGHIHNFQHIHVSNSDVDYVVNSAGSLSRKVNALPDTKFCSSKAGFSVISADKTKLALYMLDKSGAIINTVVRQKN